MSRAVLELVANTQGWDGGIKKAIQGLDNFVKANGGLHNALANNEKLFIDAIGKFGDLGSKATTMSGRVNELSAAYLKLGDMLNQMSNAEKKVHGATIIANMKKIRTEVLATKDAMNKLNADLEKGNKFGAFGAIFQGNLAAGIAMQAVRQLGQVVKDAVQTNIDFEQSNATLASILGTTTDKVKKLTENAALLGATTVWTAGQISELQQVLARRGFDQNQILAMTKGISSLATATGVGLADAAELAASAIQAFQLPATKMDDVVATLGVATTKSALDMEKLKYAFAYVAPAAKAAGFSIEEAVSMLGALADAGLPATTAGMATRNIMLDLTDSSSRLSKALGKPVHSLDEFITALEELKEKGGNNLETIGQLVDDRVVPAFSVFLNSTEKMVKMREEVTNVRDELQAMVDNQINTLQGSLTLFTSAWDGLMLSFQKSNGPMKTAIDGFTQLINKLTEYQKKKNGVDVSLYENGVSSGLVDYQIKEWKKSGMTDKQIIDRETKNLLQYTNDREPLQQTYDMLIEYLNMNYRSGAFVNGNRKAELEYLLGRENIRVNDETTKKEIKAYIDSIARRLAFANDKVAYSNYVIQSLTPTEAAPGTTPTTPLDLTGETSASKAQTPQERAQEHVNKALHKFDVTMEKIGMELDAGLITGEQYLRKKISAEEQVYTAYSDAYEIFADPEYKTKMKEWMDKVANLSAKTADLANALDEMRQTAKDRERLMKEQRKTDLKTYNELYRVAEKARSLRSTDPTSLFLMESLKNFKLQMNSDINLNIPDDVWIEFVKTVMNPILKQLKLPQIELDAASGNVTELKNGMVNNQTAYTGTVMDIMTGSVDAISSLATNLETLGFEFSDGFKEGLNRLTALISIVQTIAGIVSTIQSIQLAIAIRGFIPFFHDGGIVHAANGYFVPGAKNGGRDTVPSILAPGELVLNAAQQSNLAAQLSGQGYGAMDQHIRFEIEGTKLIGVTNNTIRSKGGRSSNLIYQH